MRAISGHTTTHGARFGIEMKIGESETVLQTVRGHERGDAVNVAQAKDERDDGLRCDGIEAGGRGIVEHNGRAGDEGPGDGDTAPHAAGELGGQHVRGVLKLDEAEHFLDFGLDNVLGGAVFFEAIGHVFAYSERIEERTFLKDEADLAAELKKFVLRFAGNVLPHGADYSLIRTKEACGEFQSESFARAGFPEKDKRFFRLCRKGETTKNGALVEAEPDIFKIDGSACRLQSDGGTRGGRIHVCQSLSARNRASLVRKVSATIIKTEETTTACVVARPTPCVPPRTFKP